MDSKSVKKFPRRELILNYSAKSEPSVLHPQRNEDAIGFEHDKHWVAVLDGVGGLFAGERASGIALEEIRKRLNKAKAWQNPSEAKSEISELIKVISRKVAEKVPGGATTLVLGRFIKTIAGMYVVIGSVGDSRAYLFREGKLREITEDDSPIPRDVYRKLDEASSDDDLIYDEINWFYQRNLLTQALGSGVPLFVHTYELKLRTGDKIIFTTDGVHDNLTRPEIEELASLSGNIADILVEKAKARSITGDFRAKKDDISAVAVEVK